MEGTDNPMVKAAEKVAEAFVLFAQVLAFFLCDVDQNLGNCIHQS